MKTINRRFKGQGGGTILVVLVLCMALLLVSASLFSTLTTSRRINRRSVLLAEAREGAEGALALATAEINRRAVAYASFGSNSMTGYSLDSADVTALATASSASHLVASSIAVKVGAFTAENKDLTPLAVDPEYMNDDSKGIPVKARNGIVFARATTNDAVSGTNLTSYVAGVVQLRERSWLNYGIFYNMDMEFHNGVLMDIYGPVHTNRDLYLATDGSTLNFRRMVTAAGHIFRGVKYCIKAFNADGTPTGFQQYNWTAGTNGEGSGTVSLTSDGGTTLVTMSTSQDCLGATGTNPNDSTIKSAWKSLANSRWVGNVMDSAFPAVTKFSPPGLPDYVPEDLSTPTVTELRNHGYAMIEPQLPSTDNLRYYGRKTVTDGSTTADAVENLKFSALAGMTIVVEDLDLASNSTSGTDSYGNSFFSANAVPLQTAAVSGFAIPWKLIWYVGSVNSNKPVDGVVNLPNRNANGVPVLGGVIDPFRFDNDDVDAAEGRTGTATIRRNLKSLLRDAIVVVPYKDDGSSTTFGTGTTAVNIRAFPEGTTYSFTPDSSTTRYNQVAGRWPALNTADLTTYNLITGNNTTGDKYPVHCASTAPFVVGVSLNQAAGVYSGLYDRRQGYSSSTGTNNGLRGAMCAVYIDLQKFNWIINHPDLWTSPSSGTAIYSFDHSYSNLLYVDLPSGLRADDSARFGLTDPDQICHARRTTATTPGYCVILKNGARLPRLPYTSDSDGLRTAGFSLATNGPLYLMGNFNSDGRSGTGSSILPDSGSDAALGYSIDHPEAEVPALVGGDAVTFLTESFVVSSSNRPKPAGSNGGSTSSIQRYSLNGYNGNSTTTTGSFMEISTAMVTGLVPTIPAMYNNGRIFSGAVNNLPRFLEDLGGITVRYRGSMAVLFECEVANSPFIQGQHSYWYDPPTRDWGYHMYFAAGKYPPGTPVVRTARLMNVYDINATTYTTGPAQPLY